MANINDILSNSIDIANIAVENQINYIQKLNKLYRTTSIMFIVYTFDLGMTLSLFLNENGTKIEVMLFYLISILTEAYILLAITLLKLEVRKDALKLIKALEDRNIVREQPTANVVEREKIDKAIEEITRLRDSTERMITEEVSVQNECYEQYVNCFDECLRIVKQNIGE